MDSRMSEGVEKRKHIRFTAMGAVEVLVQGAPPQEAYLASIARGGLGLYLRFEVQVDQIVLVNLHLATGQAGDESLRVVAKVRWARPAGRIFMAGLAFEQMSDARYARLLQHLHIIEAWQLGERASERPAGAARLRIKE